MWTRALEAPCRLDGLDDIIDGEEAEFLSTEARLGANEAKRHFKKREGGSVSRAEDHRGAKNANAAVFLAMEGSFQSELGFSIPSEWRVGIGFGAGGATMGRWSSCGLRG